jgi:hypothetical protein
MYQHLPSKPFLFTSLFHRGPINLIINTWSHEVDVPLALQGSEMAVLNLYPNDPDRTTGVHVDEEVLKASVLVDDEMHSCSVPWLSVGSMFAPRDGVTLEWPIVVAEESFDEDDQGDFVDDEFNTSPVVQLGVIDGEGRSATEVPQQETAPALQLVTVD